jgi:hypothetical protein
MSCKRLRITGLCSAIAVRLQMIDSAMRVERSMSAIGIQLSDIGTATAALKTELDKDGA